MLNFETEIARELENIRNGGWYRELRNVNSPQGTRIEVSGRTLLNFSSNDYLGFANHPALKEAVIRSVDKYGVGSGSARLICGSLPPHRELEEALATFKSTDAALTFSSGYAASLGVITALLGKDDVIIVDKLVHASIVDAARLSGAKLRVFAHNDLDNLQTILSWANRKRVGAPQTPRVLIVIESVYSMDGDVAPLAEIVALKDQYGAWLMVDEAHATGLYGSNRSGLAEHPGVAGNIEIQMGTLGKAIGAAGGYICGSRQLIDFLINRARSYIFSTAPIPASAAAASAGINLLRSHIGEERRSLVWERVRELRSKLAIPGLESSAIIPIVVGDEAKAMKWAARLREDGFFIPAIRYPTVARGAARLRVTLTAGHASDDISRLTAALEHAKNERVPTS